VKPYALDAFLLGLVVGNRFAEDSLDVDEVAKLHMLDGYSDVAHILKFVLRSRVDNRIKDYTDKTVYSLSKPHVNALWLAIQGNPPVNAEKFNQLIHEMCEKLS
jgi:hypothetical protein